jgi:hypothetical protein
MMTTELKAGGFCAIDTRIKRPSRKRGIGTAFENPTTHSQNRYAETRDFNNCDDFDR